MSTDSISSSDNVTAAETKGDALLLTPRSLSSSPTSARSEFASLNGVNTFKQLDDNVLDDTEDDDDNNNNNNNNNVLMIRVQAHSPHCEAQILQIIAALVPEMVLSPEAMAAANKSSSSSNGKKKNDPPLCLKASSSWVPTCSSSSSSSRSPQKKSKKQQLQEDEEEALVPRTQQAKQEDLAAMVNIRPLTGGLSNSLFIVSSATTKGDDAAVLVRIHPDNNTSNSNNDQTVGLVNRHIENELVAWLSTCYIEPHVSLAPHLYGRFRNGRVEEFYPRRVPVADCRDLVRVYGCAVARWLAELHRLQVPEHLRQLLLLQQQQQQPQCILKATTTTTSTTTTSAAKEGTSWWQRGNNWLMLAQRVVDAALHGGSSGSSSSSSSTHNQTSSLLLRIQTLLDTVQHEWAWLQQAMQQRQEHYDNSNNNKKDKTAQARACRFASQVVLNHGDVQSLNVLVSTTDVNDIRLIDYEYASLSPRALDMANMWLECTDMNHIRANYEADFPSPADQVKFLRAYLQQYYSETKNDMYNSNVDVDDDDDDDDFVEALRWEVGRYTVVLHLQWAIWGLEQWHRSDVSDYDYIGYTEERLRGYYHHKDLFWGERTAS